MAKITDLRARHEALTAQRSSGVDRVSYDGKTVDYRSMVEIGRATLEWVYWFEPPQFYRRQFSSSHAALSSMFMLA